MCETGCCPVGAGACRTRIEYLRRITKVNLPGHKLGARIMISAASRRLNEEIEANGITARWHYQHQSTSAKAS